jgi:P4 family phage/plasmid primase-like protien
MSGGKLLAMGRRGMDANKKPLSAGGPTAAGDVSTVYTNPPGVATPTVTQLEPILGSPNGDGRRPINGLHGVYLTSDGQLLDSGQPLLQGQISRLWQLVDEAEQETGSIPQGVADSLRAIIEPGQCFEVRILNYRKPNGYVVRAIAGWFDDPDKAATAVKRYIGKANVYFTPNPVNPDLMARANNRLIERPKSTTGDADITRRGWVLIDTDPVRPSGISATEAEKQAAWALLSQVRDYLAGWNWQPAIVADSGNGYHLMYRADLPNDQKTADKLSAFLNSLNQRFSTDAATVDTSIYNAARIWKLYGTTAVKGENMPDRPHRTAVVLEVGRGFTVTPTELDAVTPEKPTETQQTTFDGSFPGYPADDIRAGLRTAGAGYTEKPISNGTAFLLDKCLTSTAHTDGARVLLTTSGPEAGKVAYKCHHNSCSDKQWADVRGQLFPGGPTLTTSSSPAPGTADKPDAAQFKFKKGRYKLDDIGNGERFTDQHGGRVRFVHTWGRWLAWDGRHWQHDETDQVKQLAKETARSLYQAAADAAKAGNEGMADSIAKWAAECGKTNRINPMLAMAKTEQPIAITHDALDKRPFLLNVQNGTIDLETMTLRNHDQTDMLTHCLPVAYDQTATAPRWQAFLERVLPDPATRQFVQKAAGYSLSGSVVEQVLFFLWGGGANGKSTLLSVLMAVLNGLAAKVRAESLLLSGRDNIPNDIAALTAVRLVVASELANGRRLNEAMVKDLTGGDPITARFLRQEFFTFNPQFKLWMYGNHKPTITGTDDGIWRRIRLIPFTVQIPEAERDYNLTDKLLTELPGVLNWLLDGWQMYRQEGLDAPTAVTEATGKYREDNDTLSLFIEECCEKGEGKKVGSSALFKAYQKWGGPLSSNVRFSAAMQERGYEKEKESAGMFWQGIELLSGFFGLSDLQ